MRLSVVLHVDTQKSDEAVHIVAKPDKVRIKCQNLLRNVLGVLTSLFIPIALYFLSHILGNQKKEIVIPSLSSSLLVTR